MVFVKDAGRRRWGPPEVYVDGVKVQGVVRPAGTKMKTRDDDGPAVRTLVATYPSSGYIAERNADGSLSVYLLTAGPIQTETSGNATFSSTGDRGMSAAKMQAMNEESRRVAR